MATSRSRPPGPDPGLRPHRLPVGQLAWIVEKFKEWTDASAELPTDAVDRDHLLTNVMLYWLTGTAGSSAGIYYENMYAGFWASRPAPAYRGVRSPAWPSAERGNNIAHWSEFDRGGHFAAMAPRPAGRRRTFFRPPGCAVLLHGPEVAVGVLEEHIAGPGVPSGPSCWTSPTGTPRPARASRTASTSWTTSWTPLTEPARPAAGPRRAPPSRPSRAGAGAAPPASRELGADVVVEVEGPARCRRPWRRRRPRRGWGRPRAASPRPCFLPCRAELDGILAGLSLAPFPSPRAAARKEQT